MFKKASCLCLLLTLLTCATVQADSFTTFPPGKKPVPVEIGLFINDITKVDQRFSIVSFEATLTLRWHDARLAFNPKIAGTDKKHYTADNAKIKVEAIWHPNVEVVNGRGDRENELRHLIIAPDGTVTYLERFNASVESHMDLTSFPFDEQTITIAIQSFVYNDREVTLVPLQATQGLSQLAPLEEWNVVKSSADTTLTKHRINNEPFSRYNFHVHFEREAGYYVFNIILPLAFVVLLSFGVFWMLDEALVNRVALSLTALLTVVVFQWRIFSSLPHLAYHTFLDSFMLLSLITTGVTVIATLFIHRFHLRHKRLRYYIRFGFPLAYVTGFLILYFYFLV